MRRIQITLMRLNISLSNTWGNMKYSTIAFMVEDELSILISLVSNFGGLFVALFLTSLLIIECFLLSLDK